MAQTIAPKRLLIVCQHFWPESFRVNDTAEYFVSKGYDVDVLCGLPNYPSGTFTKGYGYFGKRHETHGGIRIDRVLEIRRGNNSNLRIFINYVSFPFFSLFHIPKFLLRKRYDAILLYQLSPVMMSLAGLLMGKIRKIPTTMQVLDLWPENFLSVIKVRNPLLLKILTKHSHWYYKNTDQIVALSEQMRTKLKTVTQKPDGKIIVLPQACEKLYEETIIDAELVKKYRSTFNIVFTGNISPAQSFETMIAAAKILHQKGLSNIRWVIVGDGMSRKDVEAKVAAEGLSTKAFIFEGSHPTEHMPAYTNIADVLVGCLVKSDLLEATIPAKVMSYIASGKPIVLAMDGEVQNLINKTVRCGYAGPTEDAHTLAQNIENIYHLPAEERASMGKRAQEYHFKHFERNIVLEKLERFMFAA